MWPMPHGSRSRSIPDPMSADIIVSYDGTPNDDDAIALASLLAQAGATIALAYVRHAREFDLQPRGTRRARRSTPPAAGRGTARRSRRGPARGDQPLDAEGLAKLAATERASVIVFGSDYRTPPGHAEPGTSAQNLLEGGPIAIAVAHAGLRTEADAAIASIAVVAPESDAGARRTAEALAARLGADRRRVDHGSADLTVVGSQGGSTDGRIALERRHAIGARLRAGERDGPPTGTSALA